jgi:hypothetical protein
MSTAITAELDALTCGKCGKTIGEFDTYRCVGGVICCIDCGFHCVDCDKDTLGGEYYMVSDELWAAAGMGREGMLCLACLERRIGRELAIDDFTSIFPSPEAWERHKARKPG